MSTKTEINEKPWLLIMKCEGSNHWCYFRLACASFALHDVKRVKPIEWTVVRDIRVTFWDFYDNSLLEKMKADAYQYGTWLTYAEPKKEI